MYRLLFLRELIGVYMGSLYVRRGYIQGEHLKIFLCRWVIMTEGWGEGIGQGGFVPNMGGKGVGLAGIHGAQV